MNPYRLACLTLAACLLGGVLAGAQEADESWRKACEASRITLKMTDASGPDIVRKVAELSGNAIAIPAQSPWSSLRKNYSVNFDNEPFWNVMTELTTMFPCTLGASSGKRELTLAWNTEPMVYPIMTCMGPARLRLIRYAITRGAEDNHASGFSRTQAPRAILQFLSLIHI